MELECVGWCLCIFIYKFAVKVERNKAIEEGRRKLPIIAEEMNIMETIHKNNVVIICGMYYSSCYT